MKQTPFKTRSGLQIGVMYEAPKRYEPSGDMERLQTALIGQGRSFGSILRDWSAYIAFIAILIIAFAVASCAGGLK
jgi:hypothetical protein